MPLVKNTLATRKGTDLSLHTQDKPFLVLADASGSMDEHLPNGRTRFAELKAALGNALSTREDYKLAAFSDSYLIARNPQSLAFEGGGTMLAKVLEALASPYVERILIATDGEPTDSPPERCLEVLDKLYQWVRVDVLFIGTEGRSGEILMRKVARNGGMLYTTRQDYLGGIRLLLEGAQ